ncbi:MAG: hypothetical protein R3E75_04465 [Steroidobacteraceae bacterium]|nr:hypothetical protein [Nevskiaceae bacterium]MCP5339358.1 hypothetical protein [Nevskiaceae bacterium]MCP5466541.1 hypothetical protein [Nevskiaceae bacterium]MCP5471361.1 hypothetical protein [Nevskiaceae bacterium]
MARSNFERMIPLLGTCAVLAACGADSVESPGSGGNITINNPAPTAPTPPAPELETPNLVTPANGCPTIDEPAGLADRGTLTGPTGTYRICELPARFTRSSTLTRVPGLLYSLGGRVDIGLDRGAAPTADAPVVLTIQPGVVVFASTGASWLAVNRGNRINAVGSATQPIVFTSRDNVLGLATDDSQGQWGGIVLLGRAPITDCTVAPAATPGSVNCERQTEGAVDPAYFGGATPNDNSGTLRYVQIRYSGYVLSGDSELQSLTLGGVGSATTISHIQSHNSSDDGFENFGGRVSLRNFVITGADDDSIDVDTGWQGTIQYLIAVQKTSGNADSMIELDSANALESQTPRTHLKLANFTFVHRNTATGNQAAMLFRGAADASLVNGVVVSPMPCLRLNGTNILAANPAIEKLGPPAFGSVAMQCGGATFVGSGGVTAQQVADAFGAGAHNSATFTASLAGSFINGANETAHPAIDPKTIDPLFDTTDYIGAVKDANDTWYAGWTCNSVTASFGSSGTACTSLPAI